MEPKALDPRLRLIQDIDLRDKVVLMRVDHNVVKKGRISDPYRIDATFGTLYAIAEKGGRPILMTHIGRPKDKKTGRISCDESQSVRSVVQYLEQKLPIKIHVPELPVDPGQGIARLDDTLRPAIRDLRRGRIGMIYLPNTRWFQGEESKGPERDQFARWLAGLADIYVNDAFGSWQPHGSTYDVAKLLPSYSGILLQKELAHLQSVFEPKRPFVGVVAGAKFDTKIGPLKALYQRADHLLLGGLMYNTFLSAKHGVRIAAVSEEDRKLAEELVELDKKEQKILQMTHLVESDLPAERVEGKYRTVCVDDFKKGRTFQYLLDVHPSSMEQERIKTVFLSARTIFVNAVMGLMPAYSDGSQSLYRLIWANRSALKLFGGGDTLQELRNLCPGIYMSGLDDPGTYYFTGGGSVLTAIEQGSPYGLKPVEVLMNAE